MAAYSRLLTKLSESNVLEKVQETVIRQTIEDGFIIKDKVAIDAAHFEARDQAPTRGSKAWKNLFKKRTIVERVNGYLKGFLHLNNVRYRSGKRAKIHFDLIYTCIQRFKDSDRSFKCIGKQSTNCMISVFINTIKDIGKVFVFLKRAIMKLIHISLKEIY